MAYTTVDHDAPLVLHDAAGEAELVEAYAVLERHSRFTTNSADEAFCIDCVQHNLCEKLTRANALIVRHGLMPRRQSRSRTVSALREAKRREDSWLSE